MKNKYFVLLIISLSTFLFNKTAFGLHYIEMKPTLSWKLYYDDNIDSNRHNKDADFSNRYNPALEVKFFSPRFSITGETEVEINEYIKEKGYNTVDQDHKIIVSYQPNQQSELLLTGGYIVNSDPNRYFERDEALGEGGYSIKKRKNKTKNGSVGYSYFFSERNNISFLFNVSSFDTGVTNDSTFYTFNMHYLHALDRKTNLTLNFLFNTFDYKYSGGSDDNDFLEDIIAGDTFELDFASDYEMDTYNISGGFDHRFSNDLKFDFSIGWRYTETETMGTTGDIRPEGIVYEKTKNSGDGITFSAVIEKKFIDTTIELKTTQNVGKNPNSGAAYEQKRFIARIKHEFTRRLTGSLSLQYYTNNTDGNDEFTNNKIDRNFYYVTTGLNYKYSDWLTVSLNYSHTTGKNNSRNWEVRRNTVYLMFSFRTLRPYIIK